MRNQPSAHKFLRSIARRGLMLVAALALSLEAVGPTPTRAAPASAGQSYRMTVSPYFLKLCIGQTATVTVSVDLLTRRSRGRQPARQPVRGQWVAIRDVVGRNSIDYGPPSGSLTGSSASVTFTVTGRRRGNFTILFQQLGSDPQVDELVPLVGRDEDLVPLDPLVAPAAHAALDGTVVETCAFDLFVISSGTRAKGFVERMTSALSATITPAEDGRFFVGPVTVENQIAQSRRINCATSVSAPDAYANIEGRLNPDTGVLNIEVTYSEITIPTTVVCPRASGGSSGPAKWDEFEPSPIEISLPNALSQIASWNATGSFSHTGYADVRIGGRGIWVIIPH